MFNRKLLIVGAIILVPLVLILVRFGGGWNSQSLILSPQTTVIQTPLQSGGQPDYIAALNAELSEGVMPENNAAVLILRATGPNEIEDELRREYFSRLRISPLSASGDYFVDWAEYSRSIPKDQWPQPPMGSDLDAESFLLGLYEPATERPWDPEKLPLVAKWLKTNEAPLELVVAASKLPRFYAPLVAVGDPPRTYNVLLPVVNSARLVAQGLAARAMLRLHKKEYQAAWDDLMALRRLGRLIGRGAFVVEGLVGYAIEGLAMSGQIEFLAAAELTADQWAALQKDIDALPPRSRLAHMLDRGERFGVLDSILGVAEDGPEALAGLSDGNLDNPLTKLAIRGVDWNIPLKTANEWMDRFVAVAKIEDPRERALATAKLEADLHAMVAGTKEPWSLVGAVLSSRRASEKIGDIFVAFLMPAISAMFQAEARTETNESLLVIGLALARYKAEQGEYPEKLEQLVPNFVKVLAADAFAATPFVYTKRGDGYLLYSLGVNQQDEGGKSYDQDGDDQVIQIPRPAKAEQTVPETAVEPEAADPTSETNPQ